MKYIFNYVRYFSEVGLSSNLIITLNSTGLITRPVSKGFL